MARPKRIKDGAPPSRTYSNAEQSVLRQAASILGVPVEQLLSPLNPSQENSNHEVLESEPLIFDDQSNLGQMFSLDSEQFVSSNPPTDISNTTLPLWVPSWIRMPNCPVDPMFGVDTIVPTSTALPVPEQTFPLPDAMLETQRHSRGSFGSTESQDTPNSGQDTPNSEESGAEKLNPFPDFACDIDFVQHGYLLPELVQSLPYSLLTQAGHPAESTGPRSLAVLDSTSDLTAIPTDPQGSARQAAHLDQGFDANNSINLSAIPSSGQTPQNRMHRQTSRGPRKARNSDRSPKGKNPCRGPFRNPQERLETGQTRKIGACVRCRMQRVRVSEAELPLRRTVPNCESSSVLSIRRIPEDHV
jgi:hypothetical protein